MLRFRPDIKPPRWGGKAEVEFAVRANCERLGLPFPLAWSPMWGRDFGETLVGTAQPSAEGYAIDHAAGSHYVAINVSAINLDSAALFYTGNVKAVPLYSGILTSDLSNYFGLAHMDADTDPVRIRAIFGGSAVSAWHYIAKSDFPLTAGGSWAWTGTCVGTKHSKISVGWPSQRVVRHSQAHSRSNFNLENPSQLRVPNANGAFGRTVESLYLWPTLISDHTMDQLHYQPHLLLMPVARPLYFDLGSVEPGTEVEGPAVITAASTIAASGSKQAISPATVTASASVGMGGVKGAAAPLNIVGSISVEASGIKSTSGPATITATATYGASGIKTIAGLDKEGPAIITAAATMGMGGAKGGVGAAVLGAGSAMEAGGAKGAISPAQLSAAFNIGASGGNFLVTEGPAVLAASSALGFGGAKGTTSPAVISATQDMLVGGIKEASSPAVILAVAEFMARKGLDFLPNPRISIPSKVAFRLICASRVQTSIVKKTSIGINVDTQ
jgi:hypothetical protein